MSKYERDPAMAKAEQEKIAELRRVGGDAAVSEYVLKLQKEAEQQKNDKSRRENKDFAMVFPAGWQRLQELMREDRNAARVYAFFAEHMGPDGTLCASRTTIAEALEIGERTVSRHVKTLEDKKAIFVLKVGSANVYCLNPDEVWKSFDNAKPYAAFRTKTLVGKSENPFVKKRLATLLNGKVPEQADMFDEVEAEQ